MAERGARPNVPAWRLRAAAGAAGALHAAAPGRLPGADQPAVVHAGAPWPDRAHRARDARRGHRGHQARLGVARAQARPVPARRHARQRHPPLARLFDHLRPRPPGRLHQHHAEAGRSGEGVAISGAHGEAGGDRPARRSGGRLHASRPIARQAAVHQRRQRHHADHEHAAQHRPWRGIHRRRASALGAHRRRRDLRCAATRHRPAQSWLPAARATHRRERAHVPG